MVAKMNSFQFFASIKLDAIVVSTGYKTFTSLQNWKRKTFIYTWLRDYLWMVFSTEQQKIHVLFSSCSTNWKFWVWVRWQWCCKLELHHSRLRRAPTKTENNHFGSGP